MKVIVIDGRLSSVARGTLSLVNGWHNRPIRGNYRAACTLPSSVKLRCTPGLGCAGPETPDDGNTMSRICFLLCKARRNLGGGISPLATRKCEGGWLESLEAISMDSAHRRFISDSHSLADQERQWAGAAVWATKVQASKSVENGVQWPKRWGKQSSLHINPGWHAANVAPSIVASRR